MILSDHDALLAVDLQNDFETGTLAVTGASEIIPIANTYITQFVVRGLPVFFSQCWHPMHARKHFERWPVHGVADTWGAALIEGVQIPPNARFIRKGVNADDEGFSAFDRTTFIQQLRLLEVRRLVLLGLTLDHCVRATALGGRANKLEVLVLLDATRAVNIADGERAIEEMRGAGVHFEGLQWKPETADAV